MADRRHTLRRFPVLATTSVEEAHDAVADVYLPHALRADTSLRMELNAARQKRFTLGFLAYGAKAELRMPATETTYHINLTTSGRTLAERGDGTRAVTQARRSGVVLLPDQLNTVRWTPDAEQLILKIPRTRLESHLADLVGHPIAGPIDFDFGFGMQSPRGRSLLASVEFLAPRAGSGRRHHRDTAGAGAAGGVRDDAGPPRGAQLVHRRARGVRDARPSLPPAAGPVVHGEPRGPTAHPRRACSAGVHERPGAARHLPERAGRVPDGAPAQDPARPRPRRAAAQHRAACASATSRRGGGSSTPAGSRASTRSGSASCPPTPPAGTAADLLSGPARPPAARRPSRPSRRGVPAARAPCRRPAR